MKHFCRAVAAVLLLTLHPVAHAQASDTRETSPVYLFVSLRDGECRVDVAFAERPLVPALRVRQALSAALGVALTPRSRATGIGDDGWWSLRLESRAGVPADGLTQSLHIDPTPLSGVLRQVAATSLVVRVRCPQTPLTQVTGGAGITRTNGRYYFTRYRPTGRRLAPIDVRWGYRPLDVLSSLAAAAVLLVAACLLTLRARKRALAAPPEAADAAWFAFFRAGQMLAVYVWGGWALLAAGSGMCGLAQAASRPFGAFGSAVAGILLVAPPAAAALLMARLAYPVVQRVRGAQWTPGDLIKQTALRISLLLVPGGSLAIGFGALLGHQPRTGCVALFLAYASYLALALTLNSACEMTPHALSTGALRDRVFELAAEAKVRVAQIYLLPTGRGLMSNAFATSRGNVMFTEMLVRGLARREVDAIAAHEVAHLRLRHARKRSIVLLAAFAFSFLVFALVQRGAFLDNPISVPVSVILGLLAMVAASRRFERSADHLAVKLTGDPEALISGLVKLMRLNMLPLDWSRAQEQTLTHPSTVRRAHDIGRVGGLAPGRVAELLAGAPLMRRSDNDPLDDHYPVPSLDVRQPLFSTRFRGLLSLRATWVLMVALAAIPAGVLQALRSTDIIELVLATAVTVLGASLAFGFVGVSGYRRLGTTLRRRWLADGLPATRGVFVGFAPRPEPLIYDGNYDWDCGLLWLGMDRLIYVGEFTSLAMPREVVRGVRRLSAWTGWLRRTTVVVEWADCASGLAGAFRVRPAVCALPWRNGAQAARLAEALEMWLRGQEPPTGPLLGAETIRWPEGSGIPDAPEVPAIGRVTSTTPRAVARRSLLGSLYLVALVSAGVSVLIGLPFEPSGALCAWHVMGVSAASWIIFQAPQLFGRKTEKS